MNFSTLFTLSAVMLLLSRAPITVRNSAAAKDGSQHTEAVTVSRLLPGELFMAQLLSVYAGY